MTKQSKPSMEERVRLAAFIKQARKNMGWTQDHLAVLLGVPQYYVSWAERALPSTPADFVRGATPRIMKLLNVEAVL